MTDDDLFTRALELRDSGKFHECLDVLKDISTSREDSAPFFATTGNVLWQMERYEEAAREFQKAIVLAPRWVPASLGLFHCLWAQDKRVQALDEVRRFTTLTGSDEYMEIVREINESAVAEEVPGVP